MDNYFDREILALERELSQLKTAAQRSSSIVETTSKSVQVDIPLQETGASCKGVAYYRVALESDSIIQITLDWYNQDINNAWNEITRTSRAMRVNSSKLANGEISIRISALGTDWSSDGSDDLSRIKRGESITVSATMTVRCTNNFALRRV